MDGIINSSFTNDETDAETCCLVLLVCLGKPNPEVNVQRNTANQYQYHNEGG